MISNHSLLGKNLLITNPIMSTECLKPKDSRSRKIFTRRVMKDYCKQNVSKDKATLVRKTRGFWKETAGITDKKLYLLCRAPGLNLVGLTHE